MKTWGYGLVGCGGFGNFCLGQYHAMSEVRCAAVTDVDASLARATADRYGLAACASPQELFTRSDVDIVHLATPPFTHHALAMQALRAGKHVLCEKPLAIDLDDARDMLALSQEQRRLLAVNLIMRYNPLCQAVKSIVEQGFLGEPLHAHFINDAKDEQLFADHWFWDREKSGGIFIEHGVHFFDVFGWWFGAGEMLAAQQTKRPGGGVEQVACTVLYPNNVLANFYHGFHQVGRMDRQAWILGFELGTITMEEWVPTSLRIDCLSTEATMRRLEALTPSAQIQEIERYQGEAMHCIGRHKTHQADGRFIVHLATDAVKMDVYGRMLRDLLGDQLAALEDPAHVRRVDQTNGFASLAMAVAAQRLADGVTP